MRYIIVIWVLVYWVTSPMYAQNFDAYIEKGDAVFQQDYIEADRFYTLADSMAKRNNNDRQKAIALTKKARISINKTDYEESLHLLEQALKSFTKLKDTLLMARTEQDMGLVYRYTKDYEQAATQNQKALDLWKTTKDSTLIGIGYRDLGVIYRKLGQLKKARSLYEISETYFDPKKDIEQLLTLRGNFSTLELTEKNYMAAIAINKIDLPYIKSKSKWRSLSTRYNIIASSYLKLKADKLALIYADSSVQAAEKSNMLDARIKALLTKSKAQNLNKDYKSSLKTYKLYKKLSDSAFGIEKAKSVAQIITKNRYETQKRLDSLNYASEKVVLNQKIEKQYTQKLLYLVLGILAVLVAISLWFGNKQFRKINEQKLKENTLKQQLLEVELKATERESTKLIEEAKLRTAYKETILNELKTIFESEPKSYKKELSQLSYKLKEDLRHEKESLIGYKDIELMHSKLNDKLLNDHPTLSKSERQMCSYIIAGLSIKEVAELKQTTIASVKMMRSRIRKKMGLRKLDELQTVLERL